MLKTTKTQDNNISVAILAVLFVPVPALHPLMIPLLGPPSHLLWWVYLVPVALLSYTYGARGAVLSVVVGICLLIAGERLFGYGYGEPASWETTFSLAVALAITLALIASLSVYAGHAARKLRRAAFTHPLTQLPNRYYLDAEIVSARKEPHRSHAVLVLDIDDFDAINFTLGYVAGDRVLIELASRLSRSLETGEMLAHLAGDKFAVYRGFEDWSELDALVTRIRNSLTQPLQIDGMELRAMSAGIGIASDRDIKDPETLSQNAGTALSHAKQHGRSGLGIFSRSMREEVEQRLSILNDLSVAIEQGQLLNHYQPIHAARSGAIVGVEALVRWKHPQKGWISPGDFVPLSERAGLIIKLGRAVMNRALDDLLRWRQEGLCGRDHFLNINVSPLQLLDPGFKEGLEQGTRRRGLEPECVVIEVTETAMMQSEQESLQVLEQLTRYGFRVAIDDFGSGYSSLNYLHKLPVQILKIDRLLVEQLDNEKNQAPLVKPIVEIARALDLKVIAEGVETQYQRDELTTMGADFLQGFHLSRPMPATELSILLADSQEGDPAHD
ncbi:MAG: putative bifunctional diguanylate cyclase/phosphodiesterase [Halomonas sp.]